MAITPKSIDDVLSDLADNLVDEGAQVVLDKQRLNDFNQGAKLKIYSRALARAIADCWRDLSIVERDANIATARGEALDLLANAFGLPRKKGNISEGFILAIPKSPSTTAIMNIGDIFIVNEGNLTTTAARVLASPYTVIPIESVNVGAHWNLPEGTVVQSARVSLNAGFTFVVGSSLSVQGTAVGGLSKGEDEELDDPYRTRFADYIRSLVKATYRACLQAVQSVPGIRSVSILENIPQIGFFSCYVDDGTNNATVNESLIQDVDDTLFEVRACGVGIKVRSMEKIREDVELELILDPTNLTLVPATVKAEVAANLSTALNLYGLGQVLYTSKLSDIAHGSAGVVGVTVIKPTGNKVEVGAQQVFRPRSIVINARV